MAISDIEEAMAEVYHQHAWLYDECLKIKGLLMLPVLIHAAQEELTGAISEQIQYQEHLWIGDAQALLKKDKKFDWQMPIAQKMLLRKIESALAFTFGNTVRDQAAYLPLTVSDGGQTQWRALVVFLSRLDPCDDRKIDKKALESSRKWQEHTGESLHLLTQNRDISAPVSDLLGTLRSIRHIDDYGPPGMLEPQRIEGGNWSGLDPSISVLSRGELNVQTGEGHANARRRSL